MPHAVLKLVGGVNTNETMALNENAGISQSTLIRFFYDPNGLTLVQKLGGWRPFVSIVLPSAAAYLWAWEDIDVQAHLAVGTQTAFGAPAQLSVITSGAQQIITPTVLSANTALTVTSPGGDNLVQINDDNYSGGNVAVAGGASVYIQTQIAIGGIVLFGLYSIINAGLHEYFIAPTDILGNPLFPTASASPVLPTFTTTAVSAVVTVGLPGYTYGLGDTFPILADTAVGGLSLYGNYIVTTLVDSSHFEITAAGAATSGATATLNGGDALYTYSNLSVTASPPALYNIAADWTLDNFGQDLVACAVGSNSSSAAPTYQPIFLWSPGTQAAYVIPQAPPVNDGILVAMPQRQIMAWGSTETGIQDPLLISWCDVDNPNQWIPLVTNQAGNFRIPKGSRIVGGLQGPQQTLFWTDIDVWAAQYIGPPYVYSFNEIGSGCGLIARHAAAAANGVIYWMGPAQFFTLSSNGVEPLPCPVWDVIFQAMNTTYVGNIRVGVNSRFNEIMWFFTSNFGETQNDSYVKYNYLLNLWDYSLGGSGSQMRRSAWVDQSVLGPPIGADVTTLLLMQHDVPGVSDANEEPMISNFQTGFFALNEGDQMTFVDLVWPDMKWGYFNSAPLATVQITFSVADYPGDTPTVYGPYTVTQATQYFNTRFRGRLMSLEIGSSDLGSFWRIGALRYRFAADGKF